MELNVWFTCSAVISYILLGLAYGLGTAWTTPVIATVNGTGDLSLDENAASMPTLAIASATNYTIVSQTPAAVWTIDSNGSMALNSGNTLDYETTTAYTIVVMATDGTDNAYATVNLTIVDINDNPPVIQSEMDYKCMADRTAASTAVTTLTTTDVDTTTTNNTISAWTIKTSSNPGTYFQISSGGAITTAKALNMTYKSAYALVIEAADSDTTTKLTGSTTLVVTVQSSCVCSSGMAVAAGIVTLVAAVLAMYF